MRGMVNVERARQTLVVGQAAAAPNNALDRSARVVLNKCVVRYGVHSQIVSFTIVGSHQRFIVDGNYFMYLLIGGSVL